jgi:hypothetical protein
MTLVDNDFTVSSLDHSGMMYLSCLLDVPNDLGMSSHHVVHGLDNVGVLGESVSLHHMEELVDHSVRMSSSMSDDRMELVDKSMVGYNTMHFIFVHLHVFSQDARNLSYPAVLASVLHLANVGLDDGSEPLGVLMELKDVEDLGKQLLLVQVVKLESGVHPVDDGVLVDEPRKLVHDFCNQIS